VLVGGKMQRKKLSDEITKRLKYREEFVKRSPEFQRVKQKIDKEIAHYEEKGLSQKVLTECMKLFKVSEWDAKDIQESIFELIESQTEKGEPFDDDWGLAHLVASRDISSIEIVSTEGEKIVRSSYLNHFELDKGFYGKDHALNAVNGKEKTILIKIHLDRKKEEIMRDIEFLYKLLRFENEAFEIDLDFDSKRPRWDEYDKYLQVFDLKEANPKMEWSEIAKKVFPEEVEKHKAPFRKTRKSELPSETAISKVFHYWQETERMIQGGWRQI
jgi:hypothetical protein